MDSDWSNHHYMVPWKWKRNQELLEAFREYEEWLSQPAVGDHP